MIAGDLLPVLERTLGRVDLVAYAGATWDWQRLHFDDGYAAERGLPGPIVDGQMFGALLVAQVMAWAPPGSFPSEVEIRYASVVRVGETVVVVGSVEECTATTATVRQEVTVGDRTAASGCTVVRLAPAAS